jgi:SNF2 family DNA or RNA helicase
VSESPLNAYSVLKVMAYEGLPHINTFENHFTIKKEFSYGNKGAFKKVVGYKNLADLKTRLSRHSIHRTKNDLRGFPDKVEIIKYLTMGKEQRKIYKAICDQVLSELPLNSQINLHEFLNNAKSVRLRQILNSPEVLGENCESVKYQAIDEILEELFEDPEQKVLLWTEYRKSVELLYNRYKDKYGAVKIYGGIDNNELSRIADEFENKDTPRVAVCIPAKAGTGVDFLARARTAIYVDRPYSYILYKQSLDRIHRRVKQGTDLSKLELIRSQPASVIFLDVLDSLDELIREKLIEKDNVATAVTTDDEKLIQIGRSDLLRYLK